MSDHWDSVTTVSNARRTDPPPPGRIENAASAVSGALRRGASGASTAARRAAGATINLLRGNPNIMVALATALISAVILVAVRPSFALNNNGKKKKLSFPKVFAISFAAGIIALAVPPAYAYARADI